MKTVIHDLTNQLQLTLVITYTLMGGYFFANWFTFSHRHPASTPEEKFLSLIISLVTTVFWPLIIPISCVKILQTRQLRSDTVIPLLLVMLGLTISYISCQVLKLMYLPS
ncbi:hypothetical protein [Cylindrospermopsis raciborskii]|uniref:hypothetical protein n=1 Tax=Cylindrospermopsis raciborskii TaxID=77022 RepID=UPI0038CF7631